MPIRIKWLVEHIGKVANAFHARLHHDGATIRRWQMIYCESKPGTRGGIAVIPADDTVPERWHPVQGVFDDGAGHLTRDQVFRRLDLAAGDLPILDTDEIIEML